MTRSIKNLVAAVLIALSGYLLWTEVWPVNGVISYLKNSIVEKRALVDSRLKTLEKIERLKKENSERYSEFQRLALVLPEKEGYPELITAIEQIFSNSGLILPGIILSKSSDEDKIGKIGFEIASEGTYAQFLSFLSFFENNVRLFDADTVAVGLDTGLDSLESNSVSDPRLDFSIKGKFYWLRAEAVKKSPAARVPTPVE